MRYIAFLRGINLGKRRLPMTKLKALFEELGFEKVETFIASGNVLFSVRRSVDAAQLESRISTHLASALGYSVETFLRTADDVVRIASEKIFAEDGKVEVNIHVAFLKEKISASAARQLAAVETGYDQFRVKGREFYWLTRGGISKSKVWTLPEVKKISLPSCTMRNIRTIRKLAAKHALPG